MSWEQVHDLLDSGWEVGAHTLTHPWLTRVLAEQGPEEVKRRDRGIESDPAPPPGH